MSRRPPSSSSSFHSPPTSRGPIPSSKPISAGGRSPAAASSSASSPTSSASPAPRPFAPSGPLTSAPPLRLVHRHEGEAVDFPLKDARVSIGRSRASTVCLHSDGQVSNCHAEVVNGWIEDRESTNGTSVNGLLVSSDDAHTPPCCAPLSRLHHHPTVASHPLPPSPAYCQLVPRKKTRLYAGDVVRCGTTELRVEGPPLRSARRHPATFCPALLSPSPSLPPCPPLCRRRAEGGSGPQPRGTVPQ